ncbi:MAG: AMP-binding protein, partial [Pseudomonadota bacterium]
MASKQQVAGDLSLERAIESGMLVAYYAHTQGDVMAVTSAFGERTFRQLNENANRLVRLFRAHGLGPGDGVAHVSRNCCEFVEVLMATTRAGLRFTPINFHLNAEEIGYIVDNCDALAFVADARLGQPPVAARAKAPKVRLALACGGSLEGFEDYGQALAAQDGSDIEDPQLGSRMLYTSGTTGRPKGVFKHDPVPDVPQGPETPASYRPGLDRGLVTGPAYHAAPLVIDILAALSSGVGIV